MLNSALTFAIVINELMASNAGSVMSPAINFDSWMELYNPTEQPISLAGMHLSDDAANLKRWQMPADVGTIPAKGYLVVWLGSSDIKSNQAPFKLDCDGGTIYLSDSEGTLVTSVDYPEALSRTAYARTTDGGEEWGWTANPTPGKSNAASVFASERLAAPVVNTDSKLFSSSLNVQVDIPEGTTLIYTTDGSLPQREAPWEEWLANGNCEGSDASCFVCRDGNGGGKDVNRITDGDGVNGSRGIKVHAVAGAANDWTTQFFVYTPDHVWSTGTHYRFRMKVRADKACSVSVQAHRTPGDYICNGMLAGNYDIGTEWKEIVYEGTITADQADEESSGGGWGWGGWSEPTVTYKLQTIAFNLNILKNADNNFYFDDISWESLPGDFNSKESKDGKFSISKTTNLTFRLFKDGFLPSVPVTRSYIKTSKNYTLPVISIVGDQKFFTDPKIGFDCDGDGTNGKTGNGQDWPRNYNMPWDRPVNFSYITPDGEMVYNQDVNIKVSGGWTRSQRFRSFKLKAGKVFDGQNRYDYPFFPQKPYTRNKTLLVRNGGNDVWTNNARFMDAALEAIIQRSGIDLDVQSYVPVIEYVNGELRGVLNLREPNNDDFAYANFGYDDEELDAFENSVMKNGDDRVLQRIYELGQNINEPGAYEELCELLDIDEFTNYMATTMFLDNDDWPNNNMKGYRSQHDGRYRFVSFDLDYAFALRNFNKNNDNPFSYFLQFKDASTVSGEGNLNREIVRLLLNLLGHDEYRRKFIDTFCIIAGSVFEPTLAGKIVDELLANVQPMTNYMKQQGINDGHDPSRSASTIKSKLNGRSQKMAGHLKSFSYAKLSTTAQSVTLSSDTEGARLYVNDTNVPYAYFKGHLFAPVTLRADAPAGYRFAGWKSGNTVVSTEAEMSLPTGTVALTATFEPLTDAELKAEGITPVRINEVSASNGIYVNDYFKRNDWVELYNTTDDPIDVEGMYLSDKEDKPKKYQITKGETQASTIIPAHGFLIVWCDKLEPVSQLHATFKLAGEGGDVVLTAADESWSDRLTYNAMNSDQTVGRYPDGLSKVITMNVPTIAKANIASSYAVPVEQPTLGISDLAFNADSQLEVRYAVGALTVRSTTDRSVRVDIINLAGQALASQQVELSNGYGELQVSQLAAGYYIARVTDAQGHKATCKFIKR